MNDALLELYRHKTWATLKLIELCQSLDDEYLDATIPGTYGTVRETLRHLVNAEEGYLRQLTLKRFWEPLPERQSCWMSLPCAFARSARDGKP
jgi:uncharacterized damage-inducible protein DinB